jgi:hypothetical protein
LKDPVFAGSFFSLSAFYLLASLFSRWFRQVFKNRFLNGKVFTWHHVAVDEFVGLGVHHPGLSSPSAPRKY